MRQAGLDEAAEETERRGGMRIATEHGTEIICLPDNAVCRKTGKSPEKMDMCPTFNFDDDGDNCVPELCEWYTEEGGAE